MDKVVFALTLLAGAKSQLNFYHGGPHGGYGGYGLNQGGGVGAYGGGGHGLLNQGAAGFHGLGRGGVYQGTHGHIVGGTAVVGNTGFNGLHKNFGHQNGVQGQFNNGHNRVFSKERVFSVDQAYGSGAKNSFGGSHGNFGGYGQGGTYQTNDHLNKAHAGGYGAYNGYGNGGYRNYLSRGYGNHGYGQQGGHHLNNYSNVGTGYGRQHIGTVAGGPLYYGALQPYLYRTGYPPAGYYY